MCVPSDVFNDSSFLQTDSGDYLLLSPGAQSVVADFEQGIIVEEEEEEDGEYCYLSVRREGRPVVLISDCVSIIGEEDAEKQISLADTDDTDASKADQSPAAIDKEPDEEIDESMEVTEEVWLTRLSVSNLTTFA